MSSLIENLLYQSEGTGLDFKKEQYSFEKATDEQKSELLKDVIAFSNSWRQGEAYIVIGVQEVTGGRHIPVGTEDHFDDSRLQQFINSKTNRKVTFAYEVHLFEGKKIGVIRIPKQERPIYAVKNYGKVKKEVVYYRSSSSTLPANPDDIARMGRDSVQKTLPPVIDLQFADLQNRQPLGNHIEIYSLSYKEPKFSLPDYKTSKSYNVGGLTMPSYTTQLDNSDYWRDKEKYIRLTNLLKPVAFVVHNKSSAIADNLRIEIINNKNSDIKIHESLPNKTYKDEHQNIGFRIRPIGQPRSPIDIAYHGKGWTLNIDIGSVQPKSSIWLNEHFFLGATNQDKFRIEAFIYADNLPEPSKIDLDIDFIVEHKAALVMEDLKRMPPFDS